GARRAGGRGRGRARAREGAGAAPADRGCSGAAGASAGDGGRVSEAAGKGGRASGAAQKAGRVYLVGAGPGDPGLMTRRALELVASADVILYDRLIPEGALDGARPDAELIYVGKQGRGA